MVGYLVKRINNLYDNMISYSNILFVFKRLKINVIIKINL